jgi:hypothetical protein
MKAAVLHEFGSLPRYEDFSEPTADAGDVLIHVKAAVLENFDKMAAQGVHYASKRMFRSFLRLSATAASALLRMERSWLSAVAGHRMERWQR